MFPCFSFSALGLSESILYEFSILREKIFLMTANTDLQGYVVGQMGVFSEEIRCAEFECEVRIVPTQEF